MSKNKNDENSRLTELNSTRVNETKDKVVKVINLISNPIGCLNEDRKIDSAVNDIAKGINILESGCNDMRYACNYFNWDIGVCEDIDDACAKLGNVLAIILDEEGDYGYAGMVGNEAMSTLGKVLATLVRWFDEEENEDDQK